MIADIRPSRSFVFVVDPLGVFGRGGNGRARFFHQLIGLFVQAHHGHARILGFFVVSSSSSMFAAFRRHPAAGLPARRARMPACRGAVLLHSMDPTNLYGSSAPFDVPLLDGGTRAFAATREIGWSSVAWPVLLIEQQGSSLTALASASQADVAAAVACLPGIVRYGAGLAGRHRIMVKEWNSQPVTTSPGKDLLETSGFVRDYQGMTLYVSWK